MADTKITALTAISTVDPAVDVLPIVDVSDTTMAASGTTKKITSNQILGAGGTATLASATITGDLTVDTSTLKVDSANNRVGVLNTPTVPFEVTGLIAASSGVYQAGTSNGIFSALNNDAVNPGLDLRRYTGTATNHGTAYIATSSSGDVLFYTDAQASNTRATTLRMTLNSTGLGVGLVPSSFGRFSVQGTAGGAGILGVDTDATRVDIQSYNKPLALNRAGNNITMCEGGGNVGVGVTPSAWNSSYRALQIGATGALWQSASGFTFLSDNAFVNSGASNTYITTAAASFYRQNAGVHTWWNAPSGTAGNAITFTQAMTLSAGGDLLVGTTLANASWATRLTLSSDLGTTRWAVGPYVAPQNFVISAGVSTGVYLNGTAATSWTSASDERLKDIIEPISNAVAKVGSLRAVIGKFKFDENNTRKPFLIAQDVQSVLPEAVDASNPDKLGVAYTDVIPLLVAAIKELTARVQTLEAK